jgi:phosphoribosylformylglycinamidine synthase
MKLWVPVSVVALGLAVIGYGVFGGSSDEEQILERLDLLAQTIRQDESETNPVLRGARINSVFVDLFTKQVSVRVPDLPDIGSDRRDLAGAAAQTSARYRTASVQFGAAKVDLDPSKMSAGVATQATLTAVGHDGELRRDTRGVKLQLDKVDGDWKIVSITVAPRDGEGE